MKPIQESSREHDPARQRLVTGRYRVLRGAWVTRTAKRTQGVGGPCHRTPKPRVSRGPTLYPARKAVPRHRDDRMPRPRRGLGAGHVHEGLPGNLGDPVVSTTKRGSGVPHRKPPGRPERARAWPPGGAKTGSSWYRQAKDNEARRDGRQEVGAPHSTDEAGEPPPTGSGGGKGASGYGTV